MGYDITINDYHIFLSYNHSRIFDKYNIYPRSFNGMKIKDIIPHYDRAIKNMEKVYGVQQKFVYNTDKIYIIDEINVIKILYDVLHSLNNICSPEDVWQCD